MDELKITIKKASNGLIMETLEYYSYVEKGECPTYIKTKLYQFDDEDKHEVNIGLSNLLYDIKEYMELFSGTINDEHYLVAKCSCEKDE